MNKIEAILGLIIMFSAFGTLLIPFSAPLSAISVTVTFVPVNLPSGASWYVTLNGLTKSSTGTQIVFIEPPNVLLPYIYGDSLGYQSPFSVLNTGYGKVVQVVFPSSSSSGSNSGSNSMNVPAPLWEINGQPVTSSVIDLTTKTVTFTATSSVYTGVVFLHIFNKYGYSQTITLLNKQGNSWSGTWTAPAYGVYYVYGYNVLTSGSRLSLDVVLNIQSPVAAITHSLLQLGLLAFGAILLADGIRRTTD